MTRGQLAKETSVNPETIRYYEGRGLIPNPPRSESGYRQYPKDAVTQIRFIKHAQELGFSLREILELLSLKVDAASTCSDVKMRAEAKITDIEQKIETLQRIKQTLVKLVDQCREGKTPTSECPILEAMTS